ncbi:beta-galactosidase [Geminisphaera colitermitum]|uniref:beta-galactosidase n=1 Tax=Geminisphaera colitermitum TaxID=1148786 RepID=UPI0009DDEFCA|nr:beta-galactosidase [Geminisphaera colitermitum]
MNLGVQYYRPPFPVQKLWADDIKRIRDSGLDTLQLWVTWAWVESKPGEYRFDDYDRLMEMAANAGLDVILSTIAELQPHWIHDVVPGSEMIDNFGHRVVSSLREESNFGLTPGGCTENPEVWERMAGFLREVVLRYRGAANLAGWDAWNELRWHEQSDALVCFCPHCLREFRAWLDSRYGGLDGLNAAWQRRYGNWGEVMPGKLLWRPFTEMMAWQRFVTWKANRHGKRRYDLIKSLDPQRAVTVHAGDPSPLTSGRADAPHSYALDRGNDWVFADELDGVGCSSFPRLFGMDDTVFTARVEFARSAAAGAGRVNAGASLAKPAMNIAAQKAGAGFASEAPTGTKKFWLSEVQGGRGSLGFQPTAVVDAASQQRWIWRGFASGADKLLFWCWRDEVFGRESAGFGLIGNDGHAEARIAAMKKTGAILARHRELLAAYEPDAPEVGVLFSPSSYYLHWSLEGNAATPRKALEGYCQALVSLSIPYTVIEEDHLAALAAPASACEARPQLRVLFLPRMIVASEKLENALAAFVRRGGTLVCESECGAFTPEGIYRESAGRFLSRLGLLPGGEVGRRDLPVEGVVVAELPEGVVSRKPIRLPARQWVTPWAGFPSSGDSRVLARHPDGVLVGEAHAGDGGGRIVFVGTFLGDACLDNNDRKTGLVEFLAWCCASAGVVPPVTVMPAADTPVYIRMGAGGGRRLACVFLPDGMTRARLLIRPGVLFRSKSRSSSSDASLTDLISDRVYPVNHDADREFFLDLVTDSHGVAILTDATF